MTRVVGCGAAASCAIGIGLGVWLEPPATPVAAATVINLPEQQDVSTEDLGSVFSLSYVQPESGLVDQTAAVSPPAGRSPATFTVAETDTQPQPAAPNEASNDGASDTSRDIKSDPDSNADFGRTPAPLIGAEPSDPRAASPAAPRARDPDWYGSSPSAGDGG